MKKSTSRYCRSIRTAAALILATALGACTSAPAAGPASGQAGDEKPASSAQPSTTSENQAPPAPSGQDCSQAADPSGYYKLFVDPTLTIEPKLDVYPLQEDSDVIKFKYTGELAPDATFTWEYAYIQPNGAGVSPQGGAPFFDAEGGAFSVAGPQSPIGITGGPYPGFLAVQMTSNARFDQDKQVYTADTKTLARICVMLAE